MLVRRLVVAILLLFVLISAVNYIAWRILNPLPPVFAVRWFHISNIIPTNSPVGVGADYGIVFRVRNPNRKMRLSIERFEIHLLQGNTEHVPKEWGRLPAAASVTVCIVKNSTAELEVHGRMAHLLLKEQVKVISFDIVANVSIRFSPTNWLPKRKLIQLHCTDLALRILPKKGTGDLIAGTSGKCSII